MAMGLILDRIAKVVADLSGNLDLNWVALLPWNLDTDFSGDLVRVLDRLLVALSVLFGMAFGTAGVSISWFSFGLCFWLSVSFTLLVSISTISTISTMGMGNNLRVMTNNSGAMVNLCVSSVALGGEGFLTLLDVGCVNYGFADRTGNLAFILDWLLVALSVLLVMTFRSSGVSRLSLSITLTITMSTMTMRDNLRVMTNDSRAVMDLLGGFFTVRGDDVLAFLNISCINNDIIFLMALLMLVLDRLLVALLVWFAEALEVVVLVMSISRLSFSLSFTLSISTVSMRNNLRVMTNISGTVVDLL